MSDTGTFVRHLPCEACGSSDANSLYSDGHQYCHKCETFIPSDEEKSMQTNTVVAIDKRKPMNNYDKAVISDLGDRRIAAETAKLFGAAVIKDNNNITHHLYNYRGPEGGEVIGRKIRATADKKFWSEGNLSDAGLFGQHLFTRKGKYVTVCEGELDAMSAYELLGSKWPVVSLKNGAGAAVKNCKQSFDFLNRFENVVLCFDNDKEGRDAATKVAQLFEPNKCKIVTLDMKDANEYLKTNQRQKFVDTWWAAKSYTPAGIINLSDLGSSLYDEAYFETVSYPWSKLNEKTYGMRTGELVTFTSGAGMGKSSIIRELMHHIMNSTDANIGVLALEESIRNTAFNIMSVEADARLYIKEIRDQFTQEQLNEWQEKTVGTGRFFAFDHFGSISNDEILDRVRYMAKALDCKWVFLDHLSILVSGQEDNGDERKSIDILMTKLRSLVEETGIGLLLVSHLRRPAGDKGHEDGREVSLSHLRGSASIAHLSDSVVALERNQQADDPVEANTTTLRILKNRYTGDTGVATHLHYDTQTGRMTQIDNPFVNNDDSEDVPF
jgi:twinkle protein